MIEGSDEQRYFNWLCDVVNCPRYTRLLAKLYDMPFIGGVEMDENRVDDGLNLRYRYSYEQHQLEFKALKPCSVLEVMVALAIRIEEEYMASGKENRTGVWFLHMIHSLGLDNMSDITYDERYVEDRVNKMMMRDYQPDGYGSLFYIPHYQGDLRTLNIWYQAMSYLDYYIFGGMINE